MPLRLVFADDPAGGRPGMDDDAARFVDFAPLEEEGLVEAARRGESGAFDELVRRHQGIAYRTARLIVGPDDAQDVTQEAFVKAYRALPSFRVGASFRPWLLAIVTNGARDHQRASGRHFAAVVRFGARRWTEPQPDEIALATAGRRELLTALRTLPLNDQLVLHCRFLLDLTEAETAEALGIPAGTVKSRVSRAMTRLRGSFAEEGRADVDAH
jgi:RNA polymerase sigma factor (sigma-70 family)